MLNPKTALICSVVMGIAAAALLQYEVRGGTVTVFRATRAAGAGGTLQGAIARVSMPKARYAGLASEVPTVEFERWVATTSLARDVQAGEIVSFDMFLLTASEGVRIGPGHRAVGIDVRRGSQSAGFLARPGDTVDVLATIPAAEGLSARIVLEAKKVLAVDQSYRRDDSALVRARTYSTVTLEVTPAEAEMLEAYRSIVPDGYSLALRNKADTALARTTGFAVARAR